MKRFLKPAAARRNTGMAGEDAAARHLESKGYRVLHRNWRKGRLELDVICRHGDCLVFVEVKTRSLGSLSRPDQALDVRKRAALIRAAKLYLSEFGLWDDPCRFDLVAVTDSGQGLDIVHYENAFDAD